MADYAGKIAEFVVNNRDWIRATRQEMIANWSDCGADAYIVKSNANADLYRTIEERIGVPESHQVAYDFLQDNFNLNVFRGKLETIAAKISDWYDVEEIEDRPWYGVVSRVNFVPGGASDPSLVYRGHEFNYWDIEDAIFDMYRDHLKENYPDDEYLVSIDFELGGDDADDNWTDWLRDNADEVRGYLDDYIAHGAPISWKN